MPRAAAASAMRRPRSGELVLMSIANPPSGSAARAPPEPSSTSSTCGGAGSIVTSTSAVAADSAAEGDGRCTRGDGDLDRLRAQVERADLEAASHHASAHRAAHLPQPDEAHPHASAIQVVLSPVYSASACSDLSRPRRSP